MDILDSHVQMVQAIANRIVPPDETPGAGDNDSVGHAAEVLTGELAHRLDELRAFLDRLNVTAKIHHQRRFVDLMPETQDELLRAVEDQAIFHTLTELIQQGFWASEAGQKTVGFTVNG